MLGPQRSHKHAYHQKTSLLLLLGHGACFENEFPLVPVKSSNRTRFVQVEYLGITSNNKNVKQPEIILAHVANTDDFIRKVKFLSPFYLYVISCNYISIYIDIMEAVVLTH